MKRLILLPMTVTITALVVTVFSYSIAEGKDSKSIKPRVIYGTDDRLDIYQVTEAKSLQLASSTVALIRSDDLIVKNSDTFTISTSSYSSNYNLCQEEPFYDQRTAAFCSGFLVAPDIIVTAGHCVTSEQSCKNTSFVFDFALKRQGEHPTEARKEDVYNCQSLIATKAVNNGADYAVIKLDRPVINRQPLEIRRSGQSAVGDALTVIGHPAGLPTKVSGGAQVRSLKSGFLVANLDTYGGNSGSAVFNDRTGEVEGILVRGEVDYTYKGNCMVSNVCTDSGCRGEDVTYISEVLQFLQ